MKIPYQIRRAEESQTFESCAGFMCQTEPWTRYGLSFADCRKAFEDEGREVYVLETHERIQGFAILQLHGSFKGYIQSLCVRPEFRGQGAGTQLLQFAEARIRKISPNVFICVSDFNTEAARLYFRYGFKKIGELTDFLRPGIAEWLLRKSAGPTIGYQPPV